MNPTTNWAEVLTEEYKQGASDTEVAAALNLTEASFEKNYKEIALFKQLVDLGRQLSKAWWYKAGRTNLQNKMFNTALWNFNMKNRHGWAEKSETLVEDKKEETLEEMQTKLLAQLPKILKKFGGKATDAELLMATSEDSEANVH
jgi:hypothetical protein